MNQGEVILYQTEDGETRIEARFSGNTVWLSLNQLAELFQRDKSVISRHLRNIFEDGELDQSATVAEYATVQSEGLRQVARRIEFYNLDAILAVGYRVRSPRGTQFRVWATERLREYIVKGFAMDDARLKAAGGGLYFEELLARLRDIRSSEKVFWRKVLDIYATSIDQPAFLTNFAAKTFRLREIKALSPRAGRKRMCIRRGRRARQRLEIA